MPVRAQLPLATARHVLAAMKSISADCGWRSITDEGRALYAQEGIAFMRKQPVGQISVQPGFEKYIASPFGRNSFMDSNRPTPQTGVSRSSRTRGGMRWTRQCQARNVMQGGFDEDP